MKTGYVLAGAFLYSILTIVLLTLPGSAFPQEDFFSTIYLDKWIHIGMFSILVLIWSFWLMKRKGPGQKLFMPFLQICVGALAYGVAMEYVQKWYVPNRSFDTGDIIADGVGAIMGLLAAVYLYKKIDPCGNRGRNQN
ncbi:VanZ family protein [Niabella sp. CC-SYL272]|uniref:VanZ family protein n=1 Tax=Niabella agricola TaxID=2891571 RepID=UPI001F2236EA|nr:VanZ family protein [Niabella agricola]MCF3110125.1 VanZ family protein [Niabella agricola]